MPPWCEGTLLRPLLAAALGALAALAPVHAAAQEHEPLLELEWSAPPGCPTHDEVVTRVNDLVGHARPSMGRTVSARGRVTSEPAVAHRPRYRLDLTIAGSESNRRSMVGDDCSHLVDAAALILALDIDPDALAHHGPSPEEFEHAPVPPPSSAASRETRSNAASSPRPPMASRARATGRGFDLYGGPRLVLDDGSLPRTTLGVAAFAAVTRGHLALEAQGTAYNERFTAHAPRTGRGAAYVSLATFAAHACWRAFLLDVDWRSCLGGEVGLESATGVGVARPETSRGVWSAGSLMFAARAMPRSRISPTAGLALVYPFGAHPVFIDGLGTIFEPSVLALRCFLGVDVLFF